MSNRPYGEILDAYKLWITGVTTNGVPHEPKPSWSIEFAAFNQGYYFGRMTDEAFASVTERLRNERATSLRLTLNPSDTQTPDGETTPDADPTEP